MADPAPLDTPLLYHDLPGKVIVNPARLTGIARGAHGATFAHTPKVAEAAIDIHHVPFRDRAEFAASVARIARAVAADPRAGAQTSGKYRRWARLDPDVAFAEALPDRARVRRDAEAGRIVADIRLRDAVMVARIRSAPPDAQILRPDPIGPAVPILVAGGTSADRAMVADHLRAVGFRTPGEADAAERIAALHMARQAAPDDPTTAHAIGAELAAALDRIAAGGHGLVLADAGLACNLDLWRAILARGEARPVVLVLVPDAAVAIHEMPHLVIARETIMAMDAVVLRRRFAAFGLTLPAAVQSSSIQTGR